MSQRFSAKRELVWVLLHRLRTSSVLTRQAPHPSNLNGLSLASAHQLHYHLLLRVIITVSRKDDEAGQLLARWRK